MRAQRKAQFIGGQWIKLCKTCSVSFFTDEMSQLSKYFYRAPGRADGFSYVCKECDRKVARKSNRFNLAKINNPFKYKARAKLNNALAAGKIKKPKWCEVCRKECSPHGHHDDYKKPLVVRWLCTTCHSEVHRNA